MWNLYLTSSIFCIFYMTYAVSEGIISRMREKRSSTDNILSNTSPPKVIKELQHGIKFFSDDKFNLECNIDGNPKPSYQWYVSTSEVVDLSSNIQELQFEKVSQGNEYKLEIDGTKSTKKFFKYVYYCRVQNPLGILHSNKIIIEKVSRPNDIIVKYVQYHVNEGEKFMVQCLTYPDLWVGLFKFKQWEVRLRPGHILHLNKTNGRYSVITSTQSPQLHIRNVTNEDFERTKVRCVFQSTVKNQKESIEGPFKQIEKINYDAPSYMVHVCGSPETITVTVGSVIELPWCSIPKTLEVTWYKEDNLKTKIEIDTKSKDSKYQMVSNRYGNLLILNATKDDSGKYTAITSGKIKLSLAYTVNVYEFATINLTPNSIQAEQFEVAEFNCSVTYSKSQFYWLHNGRKVTTGYDNGNIEITSTNNKSVLRIKKTQLSVTGIYQCIAAANNELKANTEYRQMSASLSLSKVPPVLYRQSPRVERDTFTAQIQLSNINKQKTIECIFAANPKPNIDWYLDAEKVPIKSLFSISIQDDITSIYNFIARLTINLNELGNGDDKRKYAGEYQAVATNALGSALCKTFVLMDGPLELRLPNKQIAVGGKDYLLSCYFVAMGVPEFSWDRKTETGSWESMPSNHRTMLRDKNHKLLLKNVIKAEDEGIYRCTAKFNRESKSALTSLEVANPPNLQNLPSKQDISDKNYHICTVNNKADKPWYVWWTFTKYNSTETKEIRPDNYNSISSDFSVKYEYIQSYTVHKAVEGIPSFLDMYPNKGVNLMIKARSYDKSALGKFTCHAKNHIGSTDLSIEDNFLSLEFQIVPPSTSEVVVGNDLYLNCTAKESDLDPYTKWRISQGDSYTDINEMKDKFGGRIYQYNNGTLVMKKIKETDPSRMFCFIIPSKKNFEVQSKVAYIDIRVPARIQPMPQEILKVAGTSFNLSCNVYGHTQNLVVTWLYGFNDQWQNMYETCIYSRDNHCVNPYQSNLGKFIPIIQPHNITFHTVHLEFRDAEDLISGKYRCKAKNKFNKLFDEIDTRLTIISKPSKVVEFEQKSSTSVEIEIRWQPPTKNGNRAILGYLIEYSDYQLNTEKRNITQNRIRVNSSTLWTKIENLRPYRTYEISIAAENEVGTSEKSVISLTTQEAQPERQVRNLKASSTQPHEILITWEDPDPQFQNGKIINYQICHQIMPTLEESGNQHVSQLIWPDNLDDLSQISNVKCKNIKDTTLTISDLPQFTDFGIRVIAFNSKGPSPPAFTKVRTLEDLPQASPTDLVCENHHQSILLQWNPPGRETINGVLIGYVVHYHKPNKYGDESEMSNLRVQGTSSVTLNQLEPCTSYSIQVMAENRKGLGPPSTRIICTTTEAKPEAPDVVKAIRVNNTCILVSWSHVLRAHCNIIEYCVEGLYLPKKKCQVPDFNKRYNSMILCDRIDHDSRFRVYARNKYDGASNDVGNIREYNGIISIGGSITANEGSTVTLPCETINIDFQSISWKKDNIQINDNVNFIINTDKSLVIKTVEKYGHHTYSCATDYDSIKYNLNVLDSVDGLLRPPFIDDTKVTENSVFVSWKSRGTSDISSPISGFTIFWENLYNHENKQISLDGNARTFYLNNVTCGSDFEIKVRSVNLAGHSEWSHIKKLRTLGTGPQLPDSNLLLPVKNIRADNVNFNLNAFGPGENCSATYFTIEISLTSMGPIYRNPFITKNISIYDLEHKCCFRITGLNPSTNYKYSILAYNPAGSQTAFNAFVTLGSNDGIPHSKYNTFQTENQMPSWLLMIILIIAVIFIMVFIVLGILYMVRNKDKRSRSIAETVCIRKPEFIPQRVGNVHDDTTSMDSNGEPSPYAVYQPDNDPKTNPIWTQQVSQTSSTPGYNYPDHLYNKIRYDKIHQYTRPMQENQGDFVRRFNSAECLSSVGNASVSGVADLESPSNIDPNDRIHHGPYGRGSNYDDVFQNIQFPSCSTVNRPYKRVRRESDNIRYSEEESMKLVGQHPNMMRSIRNDPNFFRGQPQQLYTKHGNINARYPYRQQMSVPEPITLSSQQYGYPTNRVRTHSGTGSSQAAIPNSVSQASNYGNYYETHCKQNVYPNAKRDNPAAVNNQPTVPYSKYVPNNHMSNYASQQRPVVARQEYAATNGNVPRTSRHQSSDDEIYTDKVVII